MTANKDANNVDVFSRIVLGVDGVTPTPYNSFNVRGAKTGLVDVLDTENNHQWLRLKRTGQSFRFFVRDSNHDWGYFGDKLSRDMPETLEVGLWAAANTAGQSILVNFEDWQEYVPEGDSTVPTLVSVGTLDKQTIGVLFSEQIKGSSIVPGMFSISEGTITSVTTGNQGDSVYVEVEGLSADDFTVSIAAGGITDLAGNPIGQATAQGRWEGWMSADVGVFIDPENRPMDGDDPYVIGKTVILSSGSHVEMDYVGGGSNNGVAGDYFHWPYKEIEGNFDWQVEITRYDQSDNLAGWGNGGLTVRAPTVFLPEGSLIGETEVVANTDAATRVPRFSVITYCSGSANGDHKALSTWRDAPGSGQGNGGGPGFGVADPSGLVGKWQALNTINTSGEQRADTSPTQNLWLRLKRTGATMESYWSNTGTQWVLFETREMLSIPDPAHIGLQFMGDTNGKSPAHYVTLNLRNFGPTGEVGPPEAPAVAVTLASGMVVITWDAADGEGFELLESADVAGPYNVSAAVPEVVDGVATVVIDPSDAMKFYELRHP
jgi:hypothetical protein